MKFDKIMKVFVTVVILAIGVLYYIEKYTDYHSCRYHHNVVYCLTLG